MTEVLNQTKICTGPCGRELPATPDFFNRDQKGRFGLESKCRDCRSSYHAGSSVTFNRMKRNKHQGRKLLVLSHYGGCCAICGITNPAFLTMDHIYGAGNAHRKEVGLGGVFYRWLINNGFPLGFQVLCWNHNWSKYHLPIEHTGPSIGRKRLVIDHYGGKCQCCGETNLDVLTIDHVNGGGKKQRLRIGGGTSFYCWLVSNDFPVGFRVLCFNCNSGRYINGGVCPHEVGV